MKRQKSSEVSEIVVLGIFFALIGTGAYLSQLSFHFKNSNGIEKWASLSTVQFGIIFFLMKFKICGFLGPNFGPHITANDEDEGLKKGHLNPLRGV